MGFRTRKRLIAVAAVVVAAAAAFLLWLGMRPKPESLASGNGRIEATEIDVAAKLAGRVQDVQVKEGDFVQAGQLLAQMQIDVLEAQADEARAQHQQSISAEASARAQVALRESDKAAAEAVVLQRESDKAAAEAVVAQRESDKTAAEAVLVQRESDKTAADAVVVQRESELDAAQRRLARTETLSKEGAASIQELDDDRAQERSARAGLVAAKAQTTAANAVIGSARAQVLAAQAAIAAAKSQVATAQAAVAAAKAQVLASQSAIQAAIGDVAGAQSAVLAAKATVARVEADLADSALKAPRDGRVQYLIAQPGEVLGAGGKVLNLVDLADVYMTFFLPERAAGRVALGGDVRIVLDAAPSLVIPAKVSFVASTAQFTPKTVETASERQKLMFRVKAQIDPDLLRQHIQFVKTGLPGVAWIKLDPQAQWPENLTLRSSG